MDITKVEPQLLIKTHNDKVIKAYSIKFKMMNGRSMLICETPEEDSSAALELGIIKTIEEIPQS